MAMIHLPVIPIFKLWNRLYINFFSEKAPSNLASEDVKGSVSPPTQEIPPLRGPESIAEQLEGGVQEEGVRAASLLVTASNPQSAQDDYSSETCHYAITLYQIHYISVQSDQNLLSSSLSAPYNTTHFLYIVAPLVL